MVLSMLSLILVAPAAAAAAPPMAAAAPPPVVAALNVSQYVGRWYQVYGSATVIWTMEVGGHCVTADYATTGRSDVLSVQNAVRVPIVGVPVKVNGYAVVNPACAGELDVTLGAPGHGPDPASAGQFKSTNYMVVRLGPVVESAYDYAVVSDPKALSLYVLARNVSRFAAQYEASVLKELKKLKFTSFLTRPRKTNQENCKYVPPPDAPSQPP